MYALGFLKAGLVSAHPRAEMNGFQSRLLPVQRCLAVLTLFLPYHQDLDNCNYVHTGGRGLNSFRCTEGGRVDRTPRHSTR